jgi:uncharacterized membrane protein required for colicin V production
MIFDVVVGIAAIAAIISGYRDGFIRSLLRTIGYISGAIAGLYFALQYNQSAWVILAIFIGAGLGSWAGTLIAKALKLTIIRGPLAWLNSLAGALLQTVKVVVLAYLVGTVLLWAPWSTGQNDIAESKLYLQISTHAPSVLNTVREKVESYFPNPL